MSAIALLVLAAFSVFPFLWIFPLHSAGLPLWGLIAGFDLALAWLPYAWAPQARLLLWATGLAYFSAADGVPFVGLALVCSAILLWVAVQRRWPLFPWLLGAAAALLFFVGHDSVTLHPGLTHRLSELRFSARLFALFGLFRMLSWAVAVHFRRERPSFFRTMEYLLAPAFWLSPLHGAHLVYSRMSESPRPAWAPRPFLWVLRGFLHAFLFGLLAARVLPWLQTHFALGASSFRWWEWLLLGPVLFLLAYLEKSRGTYVVAGLLRLAGHDVEPDFRSPWAARSLVEYWRRFHSWMWEYYVEMVYLPLSVAFSRRVGSPERAMRWALLFTFVLGTSLSHYVHYPAPLLMALVLGTLFGGLTLLHLAAARWLRHPVLGVAATWVSVFFLYVCAYPAYGLGWGLEAWFAFWRH